MSSARGQHLKPENGWVHQGDWGQCKGEGEEDSRGLPTWAPSCGHRSGNTGGASLIDEALRIFGHATLCLWEVTGR